jgi:hypothetical protein
MNQCTLSLVCLVFFIQFHLVLTFRICKILKSSCFVLLVGMGMHCLGYDTGIVGKNTFVVTLWVNYLAYVETYSKVKSFLHPH